MKTLNEEKSNSIWEKSNDKDEIAKRKEMLTREGLDKRELGISTTFDKRIGKESKYSFTEFLSSG